MKTVQLNVRFVTPAFLGDASQKGAWRVPPFKAQLRYWWRFVHAAERGLDVRQMHEAEGALFGSVAGGQGHASKVRMRLGQWRDGQLQSLGQVSVEKEVYLGYGPVDNKGLKKPPAIDAGERAILKIGFQTEKNEQIEQIQKALFLMDWFGQVGGRSRNGWGSFILEGDLPEFDLAPFVRDWREALEQQWPHAIGADGQPLIWKTQSRNSWRAVLGELALLRRTLNREVAKKLGLRHVMNYPAKGARNPGVKRMPNSLRFKIVQDAEGKFYGRIFHTPCKPERIDLNEAVRLWQAVYRQLDKGYQREKV